MEIENFEIFPFSMLIPDIFHLKSCIYQSTKHTGQHLFLVDPFQHSNLRSLLKIFKKNCIKLWKLKNFGIFFNFGVKLRLFHSKNWNYLILKDYRTTNCYLGERFHYSNLRSLSKSWQKLHKNVENRKILGFFSFLVPTWDFLHLETYIKFFGNTFWTNTVPCLRFATLWSTKSVENVTKIALEIRKIESFGFFVTFGFNLRPFSIRK